MQTQNYVYYVYFLVLKESEQKCVRARVFCECQNAPMFNLTSEMNSLSQFCYSLMYLMILFISDLDQT